MKNFTISSIFLLLLILGSGANAQCIRTGTPKPTNPVVSNNSGIPQVISAIMYTTNFSQITGLVPGNDYVFTCQAAGVHKYITVTDYSNNVIQHGPSPLTVGINSNQIRLHYSENAECASVALASHTATLRAVLDCSPPIDLTVSEITTTSAYLYWTPQGNETEWEVFVPLAGAPAPTAETEGVVVNDPFYEAPLVAASNYQFYVRSRCGTDLTVWNGPVNFASGCDPVDAINENFDDTTVGTLPSCWAQVKNGAGSSSYSYARVSGNNSNSPARSVQLYSENNATLASNLILATPNLGNLSAGTHRLKFFARSSGTATQNIQFGTIDSNTADGVFTLLTAINVTNAYDEFAIDYTGYTGTDTYIAIRYNGTIYNSVYLDDIRWELAPLCADVTQILIPTATTTINTATVTWTPNGGETQWDVVYGAITETDPTTLTPISPAPSDLPEVTLTGLTENTRYKVWVRSVCGADNGVWIGPKIFKTACSPTDSFNENFDAAPVAGVPDCWTAVKNGTGATASASARVVESNSYSPARALILDNNTSPATANILLVSPELTNLNAGIYRLRFFAKSVGMTGSVQVGTIDSNSAEGVFTALHTLTTTDAYQEFILEFTSTAITDQFIAFRHNSAGSYNAIYLDNVAWEPIPACMEVTGIEVPLVTHNTASVEWTAGGTETQWDVAYGLATETDPATLLPIDPAPSVASETVLTGLAANTSYNVWVRSVCSGTSNGAWIGPITFKTLCLPVTEFNETFGGGFALFPECWSKVKSGSGIGASAAINSTATNELSIYNSNSSPQANIMLVSPGLSNLSTGTHRVKFLARSSASVFSDPGMGQTGSLQVGTVDNVSGNAIFTVKETIDINSAYGEYQVDFSDYTGTNTHIAFRNNNAEQFTSVVLDDIVWELAPLCPDVISLALGDITVGTAALSWTATGDETNWQVAYGPASTIDPGTLTPGELLTATEVTLAGLADNTSYKAWVRSVCQSPDGNGYWIGPVEFHTHCQPTTVPFTENFESAAVPELPECAVVQNLSQGNNFKTHTLNNFGFNSKVLRYEYSCSSAANAWYFTRGLNLTAGTTYIISYKYGGNNPLALEKLKVMAGSAPKGQDMTDFIDDHQFTPNMALTNETTFVPQTSGVYYFGFNAYSNSCQDNMYIDDISITADLGTTDFNAVDFKFYPNPVKDVLHLSYSQEISQAVVYNILGQKVIESTINDSKAAINMADLPAGSYVVKVTSGNQTKTIKILKQ